MYLSKKKFQNSFWCLKKCLVMLLVWICLNNRNCIQIKARITQLSNSNDSLKFVDWWPLEKPLIFVLFTIKSLSAKWEISSCCWLTLFNLTLFVPLISLRKGQELHKFLFMFENFHGYSVWLTLKSFLCIVLCFALSKSYII